MDLATRWSNLFVGMSPASFFNFSFLPKYGVYFLQALGYTLLLAVISVLLAVIPALLLAFMRLSKNKFVRGISGAYIAIFRSTPLLVQLSIIYFGFFGAISIPRLYIFGFIDISRFIPGVVALALNSSAYVAEIFRAGILAVDAGQTEAARSLGLSATQAMKLVVLPQAIKTVLPALGRHHGQGIVHLLHARHGRADVCREDRGDLYLHFPRALRAGGADVFLHHLPRRQGNRSARKEDASWRQALILSSA